MNKILVLPGDGIGPSIIGSAVEVIGAVADDIELVHGEIGFSAYEASGQHLPFETLDLAGECGPTLCGPARTVKANNGAYRNPLETLKAQLDLYAMVRRFTTFSPDIGREGMDITLWASNNQPGQDIVETRDIDGITLTKYIRSSSYSRMMARALTDMEMCGGTKVKCITREDIFPESSALFEESFTSLFEANGLETQCTNVPTWASRIVRDPLEDEYIICADLYSHVAAGILAGLAGGNHLYPVGFAGDSNFLLVPGSIHLFEDVQKEYVNPTSAIFAGAMALSNLNRRGAATSIINALKETYVAGDRTPDMGGTLTTDEFTRRVIGRLDQSFITS